MLHNVDTTPVSDVKVTLPNVNVIDFQPCTTSCQSFFNVDVTISQRLISQYPRWEKIFKCLNILDEKLHFGDNLKYIANKVNKCIGLLCKFQKILPKRSLVTIWRPFIRPHLDYGDIIFDHAYNKSFH